MANNLDILDGAGSTKTVKTTDNASVHTPHHNVDSSALPTGASTSAKQDTIIGHVDGIETLLGTMDTDTGAIATSSASIDGKITACNTGAVTISAALPAGTNAIGKLAANSGVDIGDVDVASLPGTWSVNLSGATFPTLTVGSHNVTNAGTFAVQAVCTNAGTFAVQAVCTNAGTFAVQVDGAALTALQLIDDPVFADDATFTPGTSKVMVAGFQADESSTDSVDEGDAGAARMTLDRKQIVTVQPHTAGGLSIFRSLDLDETEEEVKGTAGCLYKLRITNFSTSIRYVKLYNADAAGTTVGSTTPIDTIPVPGATSATQPTVITENYGGLGLAFSSALCLAATTALADADTGAPGANEVVVSAYYK